MVPPRALIVPLRLLAVSLLLALATTACSGPRSGGQTTVSAGAGAPAGPAASDRSWVRSLDVSLQARDVEDVAARVRRRAEQLGGRLVESSTRGRAGSATARLTLRVPATELPGFRLHLRELGALRSESEQTTDATDPRADAAARLRAARAHEARVLELSERRTATLSEVLEAEKELSRLRAEVERWEAESRRISTAVELASVSVEVSPPPPWEAPGESLAAAAATGLVAARAVVVGGGVLALTIAPTALALSAIAGVWWALLRAWRRLRRHPERPAQVA